MSIACFGPLVRRAAAALGTELDTKRTLHKADIEALGLEPIVSPEVAEHWRSGQVESTVESDPKDSGDQQNIKKGKTEEGRHWTFDQHLRQYPKG